MEALSYCQLMERCLAAEARVAALKPVAWRVIFTQMGHETNVFTKIYTDEKEKDKWVRLHRLAEFDVTVIPLCAITAEGA